MTVIQEIVVIFAPGVDWSLADEAKDNLRLMFPGAKVWAFPAGDSPFVKRPTS